MDKIIARIIENVLKNMSPDLRTMVEKAVLNFEATAKGTANPWDDLFVLVLKVGLDMK